MTNPAIPTIERLNELMKTDAERVKAAAKGMEAGELDNRKIRSLAFRKYVVDVLAKVQYEGDTPVFQKGQDERIGAAVLAGLELEPGETPPYPIPTGEWGRYIIANILYPLKCADDAPRPRDFMELAEALEAGTAEITR